MKILLSGASGYIGSRLLPILLEKGHQVFALARGQSNLLFPKHENLSIVFCDLMEKDSLNAIPTDIDVAYYLVHAMSYARRNFAELEKLAIDNFIERMRMTKVKQVIYLTGLISDHNLSPHLISRYKTECAIKESGLPYTILRSGIIIGSGSASFEIIRDLTEKLPVMVAPKWVRNLCQPIAIQDVLHFLKSVIDHPKCIYQTFDIGGPDCLSYKDMLLEYAKIRGLNRRVFVVPVLTPKLSSYWLYFVTSVSFSLASALVDSIKNETICKDERIKQIFPIKCITYEESIRKALDLMEQNPLLPGWRDSLLPGTLELRMASLIEVPRYGCLTDRCVVESTRPAEEVIKKLWAIGGNNGWYYMDWAWVLRGFFDKLAGGSGLNRGRTHPTEIQPGFSLDFWRVLLANKKEGRLILYAEMKVPGEAWLEFNVKETTKGSQLEQIATFRPKGLAGRLYWYALFPIHKFIFQGMAKAIAKGEVAEKDLID